MKNSDTNLLLRDDTFLGVCEGLGEDLGIPANLFRVAFAFSLFFSPLGALGAYLGLGLLVAFTRFVAPVPKPVAPRSEEAVLALPAPQGENENSEAESLPVAA